MTKHFLLAGGVATAVASTIIVSSAEAVSLYSADFSTVGQGFTHTTSSPPQSAPASTAGGSSSLVEGRWTASYDVDPATDGSLNEFITATGRNNTLLCYVANFLLIPSSQ